MQPRNASIDPRGVTLLLLLAGAASCRPSSTTADDAGAATVAPRDDAGAKKPPALRAAKPAVPALPDLPALSAHEAPADAPAGANLGGHPCRAVWTGDRAAPLACAQSLLFGRQPTDGARLLVPRKVLGRDPASLPAISDHRLDGTEGPIRDQGQAPACTAFATAAAVDHALARWAGHLLPVSTMLIWSRYHSPFVETSLSSNLGKAVGAEQLWPFDARVASGWVPCADLPTGTKAACGAAVSDPRLAKIETAPVGELTGVEYLPTPLDSSTLVAKIASGQDVIVGMEVPSTFVAKGRAGARYVPNYTKSGGADAGHAMLLAGYVHLPHGFYFLTHNSWGPSWGDGGYAWIHEATLAAWAREAIAIDAEPTDRDPTGRARRVRGTTTCAPGLVPDSIRATCAPPCPDGSPRHDEVCAIANQCPASYVNLTGSCVLSAPSAQGKDPGTGIGWKCGPGGCAYTLPRSVDPTCSGSSCMVSCPAPDFHVARMGAEIVCVD
ncbi:MAG: C1 family peptidase [Polyangiaceae bacterium]